MGEDEQQLNDVAVQAKKAVALHNYFEVWGRPKTDTHIMYLVREVFGHVELSVLKTALTESIRVHKTAPPISDIVEAIEAGAFDESRAGFSVRTLDGPPCEFTDRQLLHVDMSDSGFNPSDYEGYRDFLLSHGQEDYELEDAQGNEYLVLPVVERIIRERDKV